MMGVNGILFVIVVGTLLNIVTMNQEAVAIPSEDEIMAEIDKEAEKINDIMNNKIENHPGMDLDGYCYNSAETLEGCTNEIAKEMEPYYDEAGKRIWKNID